MMNKYRANHQAPTRKRTHLKPSQVAVLQESFVTNPLPDATIRSRLAHELGVTERTIQIWFQNRRAKARKLEASGGGSGKVPSLMPNVRTGWIEPPRHNNAGVTNTSNAQWPPRYQATFRTMMTPERFEELQAADDTVRRRPRSSSKPEPANLHHHQHQHHVHQGMTGGIHARALSEGAEQSVPNSVGAAANAMQQQQGRTNETKNFFCSLITNCFT